MEEVCNSKFGSPPSREIGGDNRKAPQSRHSTTIDEEQRTDSRCDDVKLKGQIDFLNSAIEDLQRKNVEIQVNNELYKPS